MHEGASSDRDTFGWLVDRRRRLLKIDVTCHLLDGTVIHKAKVQIGATNKVRWRLKRDIDDKNSNMHTYTTMVVCRLLKPEVI